MSVHTPIAELAIVVPLVDIQVQSSGEHEPRAIPAGTAGTVVLVHYAGSSIAAYEVLISDMTQPPS